MISMLKNIVASNVTRYGSAYTSNGAEIKAIILKADVSVDKPTRDFTLLAGYNASIENGYLIEGQGEHFVPTKIDLPNFLGGKDQYTRGYLKQANASVDIKSYVDPANASKDAWDSPTGTDGTDWGWVTQKTGIYVNFERRELRPDNQAIGQIEESEFLITIPRSVNASITPVAELRVSDRDGRNWKVLDVDDKTYLNQAYVVRVSSDAR